MKNLTEWLNRIDAYQEIPDMESTCQGDIATLAKIVRAAHDAGFVTDQGEVLHVVCSCQANSYPTDEVMQSNVDGCTIMWVRKASAEAGRNK